MRGLFICIASLGLAACQPQIAEPNTNSSNVAVNTAASDCGLTSNTLLDEKALFAAETAYNVAAHSYVTADGTGKLPIDLKASVKPKLIQAYDYLKLARAAYGAADGCNLLNYSRLAQAFANSAKNAIPN